MNPGQSPPASMATVNPVLAKELKERARSPRAVVILVAYLGVMSLMLFGTSRLVELSFAGQSAYSSRAFAAPVMGRVVFETLVVLLLAFVALITPGIAAGSIVGEKERRTLPLLQVTLLEPKSIVLGKLGASLSFSMLLLVASAPLFAIPFFLGGITIWQVVRGLLVTIAVSLVLASLGIFSSAVASRSQFATVMAYALTFAYFVGTLFLWAGEAAYYAEVRSGQPKPPARSVYLNPITGAASAVAGSNPSGFLPFSPSPLSVVALGLDENQNRNSPAVLRAGAPTAKRSRTVPVWLGHIIFCGLISALLVYWATGRVRAPAP